VYNHTCFSSYRHLCVGNGGGEYGYWLLGETNATLLGVFQVTLFCSGPRRTVKEAAKTVQALIAGAKNAKERQQTPGQLRTTAAFEVPREALRLPESHRAARQEIPVSPSGRTLRGAGSEIEQMHNYISRIGTNLIEAIGNRDADLIRSYCRALNSEIARAHEAVSREAGTRGWDPVAVDGMLQEVFQSTATLLPTAEQVL
jgi:hypothetical protein